MGEVSEEQSYGIPNDEMRRRLLTAAWFLMAYEILKSEIIDRVKQLFAVDNRGGIATVDSRYQAEVRALAKHQLEASLLWLQKQDVVTQEDISDVDRVRNHRNDIAHRLVFLAMEKDDPIDRRILERTTHLIIKLGRHWARTRFPFGALPPVPAETPEEEIFSSTMWILGFFGQLVDQMPTGTPAQDDTSQ